VGVDCLRPSYIGVGGANLGSYWNPATVGLLIVDCTEEGLVYVEMGESSE